ncbi:MAG: hypothetical protein NPIRA05_09100 [Nitrospirales bacterium]|nr:MAG: hypothetical protein NPIRA05_09100 [Nitrospirales bacterium]
MVWSATFLFAIQLACLSVFFAFAFFNYLYAFASLRKPHILRVPHQADEVAVVVVAYNEKYVLERTLKGCEQLTYPNRFTVLADDSTDPEIIKQIRQFAIRRGCTQLLQHPFTQEVVTESGEVRHEPIEIWESKDFVLFHRPSKDGFKAGSLRKLQAYLERRGTKFMYLLDADWKPQSDALERTLEVVQAQDDIAFVQTKRVAFPYGMNVFQKYVSLSEEGCYYVDFEGRQVLGHPTLFSGCCTMFRLAAVVQVGGFTPGHLTEDIDLTNRFWLAGWKGVYLGNVVNYGEVPFTLNHFRRQQERWCTGTARVLREYFWAIVKSDKLTVGAKLSALRQNAYYTTPMLTGTAILLGMVTVWWLAAGWNSYEVEYYLYLLSLVKFPFIIVISLCLLSNLIEPFVMIVFKKHSYRDLFHFPMMLWYGWSVILTYIAANLKGLFHVQLDWFRTPKFLRHRVGQLSSSPLSVRVMNLSVCMTFMTFYFAEGWVFGWFDTWGLLLVPAFLIASVK